MLQSVGAGLLLLLRLGNSLRGEHSQQVHDELVGLLLRNEEHVVFDELRDEASSQLGGNLEGIHSQAQQHLDDVFRVVFIFCLDKFVLVLCEDGLGKELALVVLL